MSQVRLDSRLVAQGFDRNRNGVVNDDLQIRASGMNSNPGGAVAVSELATALSADRVVISNGAVQAGQSAVARNLPEIKSLSAIRSLSQDALGYFGTGNAQYPGIRYQSTREDKDGNVRTTYNFGQAITDLRIRLQAIASVAGTQDDFQSKTVARLATQAVNQNNWDYMLDNGTAQSRYAALFATVQNISELSITPEQPAATEATLYGSVNDARKAIQGLESTLASPATKTAETRAGARVSALKKQIETIPTWQKFALVGLFRKGNLEGQIRDIQSQLATLKSARPQESLKNLSSMAARAYEVGQSGAGADSIDEARKYADEASPLANQVRTLGNQATGEANAIRRLLDTLSK